MVEGVVRVTGFVDSDGPMVRVALENGSTFIGPLLPTMADLLKVDYYGPIAQKKTHHVPVGR